MKNAIFNDFLASLMKALECLAQLEATSSGTSMR